MSHILMSLRLAARRIVREKSYSLLIVGMLGLGIAGNIAVFSLVHALWLEELPFEASQELTYIDLKAPKWGLERVSLAYSDFDAWREHSQTFESMALTAERAFNLVVDGTTERVTGAQVTFDLPNVLRLSPRLGRFITAEEDQPGGPRVTVISHGLWQRLFSGSENVLGRLLELDGESYEIVGVLPKDLSFPTDTDLWVPIAGDPATDFGSYRFSGIGRLAQGASLEQAREELAAGLVPLQETWPFKKDTSPVVRPLREELTENSRSTAWALQIAVLLVLWVACANVAGLLLARGASRTQEIGLRIALGAERRRVVGQLLAESLMLAAAGTAVGIFLGYRGLSILGSMAAEQLPFWVRFEPNLDAMVVCVVVCVGTVLLFGLLPAWQTSRVNLQASLRSSAARTGESRGQRRWLQALVVAEVALAQLLLVGAGVVALSQSRLLKIDPGFNAEGVLAFSVALPAHSYPEEEEIVAFFNSLQTSLTVLPGVQSAALSDHPPLFGHSGYFLESEHDLEDTQRPVTLLRLATDDYPQTVGLNMLKGRFVREGGLGDQAPQEIVVNETFAQEYFPNRDPIGQRVRLIGSEDMQNPWMTVVGLSRDVRHYGLDQEIRPGVYLPLGQTVRRAMVAVVRTDLDPMSLLPAARQAVRNLDPQIPLFQVTTLEQEMSSSLTLQRLTAWLFGLFAAVALILAASGAYATLSYAVQRQRRDLGIRMALGARPMQVLRGVLTRGLKPVAIGGALGLGASWLAARGVMALVHGVDHLEPWLVLAVLGMLACVAILANALPALRASRVDPIVTLREE